MPFCQCVLDAESVVGLNCVNLDIFAYCNGEAYGRATKCIVLESTLEHWEKKYTSALELEKQLYTLYRQSQVVSPWPVHCLPVGGGQQDHRHGADDVPDADQFLRGLHHDTAEPVCGHGSGRHLDKI